MEDTIKVFVDVPFVTGYVENAPPPNRLIEFQFTAQIKYLYIKDDVIGTDQETWIHNTALGESPGAVYSALYANIIGRCADNGFPTPGQDDIFCYIPTALSQIFINIPSLA